MDLNEAARPPDGGIRMWQAIGRDQDVWYPCPDEMFPLVSQWPDLYRIQTFYTTPQAVQAVMTVDGPLKLQPLDTVLLWADEFPKDMERLAGGMIARLLREYAEVRKSMAPPAVPLMEAA